MSISTIIEVNNIKAYAELLKRQYELREKLSFINDKLINLSINMSNEDINKANILFKDLMENEDEIY